MPLLFYLPLIIWMGLVEVAQDAMRVPSKSRWYGRLDDNRTRHAVDESLRPDNCCSAFASEHSVGALDEKSAVVTRSYDSSRVPAFDYRRGTSDYPFGLGYNFPYPDRPYGDPGHW
jgi:hypothetical protein